MELTQNNLLNVDRKPGSTNRLAFHQSTVNAFGNRDKLLSVDTLEECTLKMTS